MGSSMSFYNDTSDRIMIKRTANTKVIAPVVAGVVALTGGVLTIVTGALGGIATVEATTITYVAIAGGAVSIGLAAGQLTGDIVIDSLEDDLASGYIKEGWMEVLPGKEYKWPQQSLSLNQRLWCVRFSNLEGKKFNCYTADSSVWTGPTVDSNIRYIASKNSYFSWKQQYSYDVEVEMPRSVSATMRFVDPRDPTRGGTIKPESGPFDSILRLFC